METANDRLELLKWVAVNEKKVLRLTNALDKLAEHIANQTALQDVQLHIAVTKLNHLVDRMDYLNSEIDSQHFVNEGLLRIKDDKE